MSLTRVWIPSRNYSSGTYKRLIVIHTMEGFTGPNGALDCARYFQGDVGASSQVCIDNNRGKIWECVSRNNGAWTQCSYNAESISGEQSGYASWSKSYWLANRDAQLHNMADWIAEESRQTGIPIRLLTSGEAQGGGKGVTFHSRLGSSGCGHSDPGDGFPINEVLEWAKGGTAPAQDEGSFMASSAYSSSGGLHQAMINEKGTVCYGTGNDDWYGIDSGQTGAKGGAGITISDAGAICITYINASNRVCTYIRAPGGGPWAWADRGGNAKG